MAGLKKSSKKDGSNPNMVLVIALIMFVLIGIGLGVYAYYGYEGQEKLRQAAKNSAIAAKTMEDHRNAYKLLAYEGMLGQGVELDPTQKTEYATYKNDMIADPNKYQDIKANFDQLVADHAAQLNKSFNAAETKYDVVYKAEIKKAVDEAKKSRALLDSNKKEYEDFKGSYDTLAKAYEKDIADVRDKIRKGSEDALKAALQTNTKFPEIQKLLAQAQDDIKKKADEQVEELNGRDGRIARLNNQIADLEKKLTDRSLGTAIAPQGGGGDVHALMLDISRGLPLWDKPLGKILRVDPTNLLVYIDMGSKAGVKADVTFNVFASGPGGKADRQIKGTIEVVRVVNETTSVCRITSLYDDKGESIPLESQSTRSRAIAAADSILREGDLLFNTFFDMHVFIAGNVNFTGFLGDSPASQNMQMQEFINQLRKQNVVVDGYINLLNGQVEGNLTPKTRLLIRGEIAPINRTEEETNRFKQIVESYQILKRQAIEQGMFVISAENFAAVTGYRGQLALNNKNTTFRPSLPWTGGPPIQRFDRVIEGAPGAAVAPPADPKKEMEK